MNEQQQIAEIQQKISSAGTTFERSAWQTKLAWHFAERQQWLHAGREFHKASQIALAESEADKNAKLVAAQLCRLEGLAWANGENHRPEAMRALEQSLLLYENLADRNGAAEVQSHLDSLARSGWQEQQLADSLDDALAAVLHESDALLDDLETDERPETMKTRIPLLRTQAMVLALNGDESAAQLALQQAIEMGKNLNDERLIVELETELALLPHLQTGEQPIPEKVWQQLLQRTAEQGSTASQTTLLLEQAARDFGDGLFDDVIRKAGQARLLTLDRFGAKQLLDYFSASMMLASAHERRGDDVDVIDTLLRCKATLERELGKPAGEPLKEMLNALAPRWGDERFNLALGHYRQMMRSAGGKS